MPLANYGLLIGDVIRRVTQPGGNPHDLLFVEAAGFTYRVAVNLRSTLIGPDAPPPELQVQIVEGLEKHGAAAEKLIAATRKRHVKAGGFYLKAHDPHPLTLDYVHDDVLSMAKFKALPDGSDPDHDAYADKLAAAAQRAQTEKGVFVAVFGTGYPDSAKSRGARVDNDNAGDDPLTRSFAFDGVDNVHMNQGSFLRIGGHSDPHFRENGRNQDGAIFFFFADKTVTGFFSKFQTQDSETDAYGNPRKTGVHELDRTSAQTRTALTKRRSFDHLIDPSRRRRRSVGAAATPGGSDAGSPPVDFVFADTATDRDDPKTPFKPDDDSDVRYSPYLAQFAEHGVPEPVPGPRKGAYPVLSLSDILGVEDVEKIKDSGQIVFHGVGDTGSATGSTLPHEDAVADQMSDELSAGSASDRPRFLFHLGDVVYYFGEQQFYYEQFYKPYRNYAAPIFAIPGNHDGVVYSKDMVALEGFVSAFCDSQPRHWTGAGGISRTTMTQPSVYFTLDAPFVSIVGLYSNCSEYYGYIDDQQKLFLFHEMQRLKKRRDSGETFAVVIAVHHPPLSFDKKKPSSTHLRNDMDNAFEHAGFWPDAVLSGHAHIYQRMTRTLKGREIPYIISGSGGYAVSPKQELDKKQF